MNKTVWLFLLASLWMLAKKGLCFNLSAMLPRATRSSADDVCKIYNKSMLPDISQNKPLQQVVLSNMDIGDFVWIDAIQVTVKLLFSTQYLKLSNNPTDSKITSYFKPKGTSGLEKCDECVKDWNEIDNKKVDLADMSNNKLRSLAIVIKPKQSYWVKNYPGGFKSLDPVCVGITKTDENEFEYKWDNCTNEHRYFCVNVTTAFSVVKFERALKPVICPDEVDTGNNTDNGDLYEQRGAGSDETSILAPVLGGVFGLVGLTLVVTAIFCFLKRRSNQQRHAKMRQRYQNSRQGNTLRAEDTSRTENERAEMPRTECQQRMLLDEYEDYEKPIKNGPVRQSEEYSQTPGRMDHTTCGSQQYECCDPVKKEPKRSESQRSTRNLYKIPKKTAGIVPPAIPNPKFKKSVNRAASFSVKSDSQLSETPLHRNFSSVNVFEQSIDIRVKYKPQKIGHAGPTIEEIDGYENQMVDNPGYKKKSAAAAELEALDQYENYGEVLSWKIGKTSESLQDNTNENHLAANGTDLDDQLGADQYENYVYHLEDLSKSRKSNSSKSKGSGKSKARDKNTDPNALDELDQYENYQTPKMPRRQNIVIEDEADQYESYDEYKRY